MDFEKKISSDEFKFMSISDLAVIVLKETGKPMSPKEITSKILEKRLIASSTPSASVFAALQL